MVVESTLNPAQRNTLGLLGAGDTSARQEFDRTLAERIRAQIESDIRDAVALLEPGASVTITKHLLNGVHGCEARFLAEEDLPFVITVPIVRGTIAHKALELSVHWNGTPLPLDLLDAAITSTRRSEHWAADWLNTAEPELLAELRSEASAIVTQFLEMWPPLTAAMRPATEARMWSELSDGRVVLKGQADLTLGQPIGSGTQARKIIVDYKTGSRSIEHRGDLRFYALVETLRLGVPPRLLVTAYLNAAILESEEVTEELLWATAARLADGIGASIRLHVDRTSAIKRPSPKCRWCGLLSTCDEGLALLAQHADDFSSD